MRTCVCDLCKNTIDSEVSVELTIPNVGIYDFCNDCVRRIRRAICKKCKGTGKYRERDEFATDSQATCGENRTQYRTIICHECM